MDEEPGFRAHAAASERVTLNQQLLTSQQTKDGWAVMSERKDIPCLPRRPHSVPEKDPRWM